MQTFKVGKDWEWEFKVPFTYKIDMEMAELVTDDPLPDHKLFVINDKVVAYLESWGDDSSVLSDAINEILWFIHNNEHESALSPELWDLYGYLKTILVQPFVVGQSVKLIDNGSGEHVALITQVNTIENHWGSYFTYDLYCNNEILENQFLCQETAVLIDASN